MENKKNYDIKDHFTFRTVTSAEAAQTAQIEAICFPPKEACPEAAMKERVAKAADLFLVAVDKENGKIAGFLNGIATDETVFRDEFFSDAGLHDPKGRYVMLLGLDVLPEYRGHGLAAEIMSRYLQREKERGREAIVLTCLEALVPMYEKMGFQNQGISNSVWGGEQWHEMSCAFN